jgi:hypothetical protein
LSRPRIPSMIMAAAKNAWPTLAMRIACPPPVAGSGSPVHLVRESLCYADAEIRGRDGIT